MTTTSHQAGIAVPFAIARYRDGKTTRLGLVSADRIRPLEQQDLGAGGTQRFPGCP